MIRFWIVVMKRKIRFRIQESGFGFSQKTLPKRCIQKFANIRFRFNKGFQAEIAMFSGNVANSA